MVWNHQQHAQIALFILILVVSILKLLRGLTRKPPTSSEPQAESKYSSPEAELINLPTELIHEILSHLDNASLLQLGRTCKQTNRIALSTFFNRNDIGVGNESNAYLIAYETPPETLQAVRAALWVKSLDQIDFSFQLVERLEADVADLCALVRSVSALRSVKLDFSGVDRSLSALNRAGTKPKRRLDRHGRMMHHLLDSIVGKGCCKLEVRGGDRVRDLYKDEIDVQWLPKKVMRNVERLIQSRPKSTIKKFDISSDMLLQDTLFPWTINTLSRSYATITQLFFCFAGTPPATWSVLLRCLSLPYLTSLDVYFIVPTTARNVGIPFIDLQSFLGRHPSIQQLCLKGVERPSSVPVLEHPILPNLELLKAHPVWINSFLATHERHPDALPHLQSIELSPDRSIFNSSDVYDHFDWALDRVARLSKQDVTLTLTFNNWDRHLAWFQRHVGAGESVLSSLSFVSTLIINGICVSPELLSILPAFLGLFPRLRIAQFGVTDGGALTDPGFVARLATECLGIRKVEIRYENDLDLEQVRASMSTKNGHGEGTKEIKI